MKKNATYKKLITIAKSGKDTYHSMNLRTMAFPHVIHKTITTIPVHRISPHSENYPSPAHCPHMTTAEKRQLQLRTYIKFI